MSALVPSSVTICPFTDTAPEVISFSALRREAIPAAAMIFCKRSAGMYGKGYQEKQGTTARTGSREAFADRAFGKGTTFSRADKIQAHWVPRPEVVPFPVRLRFLESGKLAHNTEVANQQVFLGSA